MPQRPPRKPGARPGTGKPSRSKGTSRPGTGKSGGRGGRNTGRGPGKGRPSATSKARRAPAGELKVRWTGFRTLYDFWGDAIPRHFTLDSLANAVDWAIHRKDLIFAPTVHGILGPSPLTGIHFELFQEGRFQLIFRMAAGNTKGKLAECALVAAKREGEVSKLAKREHDNLAILHGRAPEHVVKPYLGGQVFMPRARPGKGAKPRYIYVYLTQWLRGYHEMGVQRDMQFYVNIEKPLTFSIAQTEVIKRQIIEIVARTYHPVTRDCMEMPQIASGDFVVTKPAKGEPRVKLIACRRMLKNVTPEKLVGRIIQTKWDWGGSPFSVCPTEPKTLVAGLEAARGKEEAVRWIQAYCDAVRGRRLARPELWSIEDLRAALPSR